MLSCELEKEYKNYKKEEWSPTSNYFLKLKTGLNGPFKTKDYMYILCQGVYCTKHRHFFSLTGLGNLGKKALLLEIFKALVNLKYSLDGVP